MDTHEPRRKPSFHLQPAPRHRKRRERSNDAASPATRSSTPTLERKASVPTSVSVPVSATDEEQEQEEDVNVRMSTQAASAASYRRHARRSSSATGTSTSTASPTTPGLRKRLGKRGRARERERETIVISLPPMSPLSPARADKLHTPLVSIEFLQPHPGWDAEVDSAPLSATLREIGAKRSTHVPDWARRFQANHHRRNEVLEQNRAAVADFALPRLSCAGDTAPSSPNGDLLHPHPQPQGGRAWMRPSELIAARPGQDIWAASPARPRIDSVAKGRPRDTASPWPQLVSALRAPPHGATRDGWGGILTRASWFRSHTLGPLLSPAPARTRLERRARLRSLHLVNPSHHDVWEDLPSPSPASGSPDETPSLEQGVPRFKPAPPQQPPKAIEHIPHHKHTTRTTALAVIALVTLLAASIAVNVLAFSGKLGHPKPATLQPAPVVHQSIPVPDPVEQAAAMSHRRRSLFSHTL